MVSQKIIFLILLAFSQINAFDAVAQEKEQSTIEKPIGALAISRPRADVDSEVVMLSSKVFELTTDASRVRIVGSKLSMDFEQATLFLNKLFSAKPGFADILVRRTEKVACEQEQKFIDLISAKSTQWKARVVLIDESLAFAENPTPLTVFEFYAKRNLLPKTLFNPIESGASSNLPTPLPGLVDGPLLRVPSKQRNVDRDGLGKGGEQE